MGEEVFQTWQMPVCQGESKRGVSKNRLVNGVTGEEWYEIWYLTVHC